MSTLVQWDIPVTFMDVRIFYSAEGQEKYIYMYFFSFYRKERIKNNKIQTFSFTVFFSILFNSVK